MSYLDNPRGEAQKKSPAYKVVAVVVMALSVGLLVYINSLKTIDENFGWSP